MSYLGLEINSDYLILMAYIYDDCHYLVSLCYANCSSE
jgi:hypothetical protein